MQDIEIFVLGDGACEKTREVVRELMGGDGRVKFFDHPKHERRGEPHRHAALAEARGDIVCYLCDRDLMLPWHVETMLDLLRGADFGHSLVYTVGSDDFEFPQGFDLAHPRDRAGTLRRWSPTNGVPLSFVAHTLETYRRLPLGWRTTPVGQYSDLYMWKQFLERPECRAVSGTRPTILYFPTRIYRHWTMSRRAEELARWRRRIEEPDGYERLLEDVLAALARHERERARWARPWTELSRQVRRLRGVARPARWLPRRTPGRRGPSAG